MIFDSKYEVLLRTAYHYYCNVSQSEPCRMRLVNGADGKLSSPDERLSNARYLEKLGLLDTVSLDDNVLYCRLTQKDWSIATHPQSSRPPHFKSAQSAAMPSLAVSKTPPSMSVLPLRKFAPILKMLPLFQ